MANGELHSDDIESAIRGGHHVAVGQVGHLLLPRQLHPRKRKTQHRPVGRITHKTGTRVISIPPELTNLPTDQPPTDQPPTDQLTN